MSFSTGITVFMYQPLLWDFNCSLLFCSGLFVKYYLTTIWQQWMYQKKINNDHFLVRGILGSASLRRISRVPEQPCWLYAFRALQQGFVQLKTGWAQDTWLQWSYENWYTSILTSATDTRQDDHLGATFLEWKMPSVSFEWITIRDLFCRLFCQSVFCFYRVSK